VRQGTEIDASATAFAHQESERETASQCDLAHSMTTIPEGALISWTAHSATTLRVPWCNGSQVGFGNPLGSSKHAYAEAPCLTALCDFMAATSSLEPDPHRATVLAACAKGTSSGCTRFGSMM
jgi:hypothetical protein